ncbi:tetratricopeptide repeat protein [Lentzea sp. HUAS12]|uniref:tetratricopeptide repeat protein n=1 Tax=Lentzea sp. HUAS12 TaxID=2951806 RepID=UPI0020A0DA9F|nr:tetratricopeptide repeat protein [Lentzea sp. HUAS12]USX54576.1 tetratricopeptide repeat protein [Lentzea sp. HUAS12]
MPDRGDVVENRAEGVRGTVVQAGTITGDLHVHERARVPTPRQLPAPPALFTGRADELAELEAALRAAHAARPAIFVLTGPAGVGKTALLLQWASSLDVPDGQLFVDLNGFSLDEPMDPEAALGSFLRALGTPPDEVPVRLSEQAALYRSLTADKALLVVLDNAFSAAQARVLFPASPASVVVVSSRSRLTGLVSDGAHLVEVGPLPPAAAVSMLTATVGEVRVAKERKRSEDLMALCGGMPIAIRVAAARLLLRSRWPVRRMYDELAAEQSRLARLTSSGELSVQACFDLSYKALAPAAAALYRRLSVHPDGEFGAEVASAVVGGNAEALLDSLLEASLIEECGAERHRFHNLLRLHAQQRLVLEEPEEEVSATLRRIAEWYLATARKADEVLTPYRKRTPYVHSVPPREVRSFDGRDEALAWLELERPNLIAVGKAVLQRGFAELAWHLADVLWPLFLLHKHYRDRLVVDELGVEAARRWGQAFAEADMRKRLGRAYTIAGRYDEAEGEYETSMRLWSEIGDHRALCDTGRSAARLHWDRGRLADARAQYERVAAAAEELGAPRLVGLTLVNLGLVLLDLGRPLEAVPRLDRARRILAEAADSDPYNAARAVIASAVALCRTGSLAAAEGAAAEGLRAMTSLGSVNGQAEARLALGEIAGLEGDVGRARAHYQSAEDAFRSLGSSMADVARQRLVALD